MDNRPDWAPKFSDGPEDNDIDFFGPGASQGSSKDSSGIWWECHGSSETNRESCYVTKKVGKEIFRFDDGKEIVRDLYCYFCPKCGKDVDRRIDPSRSFGKLRLHELVSKEHAFVVGYAYFCMCGQLVEWKFFGRELPELKELRKT